jgi:hypothetical protein
MSENQVFLVVTPTLSYDFAGIIPFNDRYTDDNSIYDGLSLSINYVPNNVYVVINNEPNSS